MTVDERMHLALRAPDATVALEALVLQLSAEGHKKGDIYKRFLRLWDEKGMSPADEAVTYDLLDRLSGYCAPKHHLLPGEKIPE